MDTHPVVGAIVRRWECSSVPGHRDDGLKIGLAIEGGGMRGVVSAGMVTGLEYLGLLPAFDVVYGTSAGAINGAFFIAGQAAYGTTIYYENINNSHFINLLRPLIGKSAVSLEFLFEQVLIDEKILDWKKVVNSAIPLKPVASSINHVRPVVLDGFATRDELFTCLKASARIPVVAGPPVRVGDDDYLDGSLFASIPFHQAVEGGCTHVLSLLTRPLGLEPKGASVFDRQIVPARLSRYNIKLGPVVTERLGRYAIDIEHLTEHTLNPNEGPFLFAVQPDRQSASVGRLEKSRNLLIAGARDGMKAIMEVFSSNVDSYTEILCPFQASGHPIVGLHPSVIPDEQRSIVVQV
jgi:predicted patatin/cPLA2 family phospholipase